jgi:hypothetical protein
MQEDYPADMGRIIQIRDVDEVDYAVLTARAAAEGLSLTAYLRRELHQLAQMPTMAEWIKEATNHEWSVSKEAREQILEDRHREIYDI